MRAIINFINKSQYAKGIDEIKNFSFTSSTKRKDNIYERYAKRIIKQLNGDWGYSSYDGGFYFFRKEKIDILQNHPIHPNTSFALSSNLINDL